MLKEFLLQLSKDLNVEPFVPNDDGSYLLSFDSNVQISLRENANSGITLHTKIGAAPLKDQEEFYLKLMKANLLGKETGEAFLGLDKESKEVTMTAFFAEGLKNREFHDGIEEFVNYAESWQKEVLEFAEQKR